MYRAKIKAKAVELTADTRQVPSVPMGTPVVQQPIAQQPVSRPVAIPIDTNQDGRFDAIVLDTTGDGRPDTVIPTTPGPMPVATVAGFLCSPPSTHPSQDPPPYGMPVIMQCN